MVMPGDTITLTVKLGSEVAMEEGMRFAIREGGRTVGEHHAGVRRPGGGSLHFPHRPAAHPRGREVPDPV